MTMSKSSVKEMIGNALLEVSEAIESGQFGKKVRIGITTLGSEHGTENLLKAAELASKTSENIEVVLIGPKVETELAIVEANSEDEMYSKMEELLDSGELQGCVTMHYNFPVGVSTVGRVITPGMGKEMFLATTTGTAAVNRVEAMVKNALHGIITAKSMGIEEPTVGILNLDGARQVERILKELNSNGYKIKFADSARADGGAVMRGNDLLAGTADVMITDTLTGNIMMKVFSAYTTGGSYEATGYGYGPGVGEGYERNILIVSRASGIPVVANAIKYAADLAKGKVVEKSKAEFKKAKDAKLNSILESLNKDAKKSSDEEEITAPPKQVVTGSLSGVDIMELEDAVKALWKNGIYAESGMGCTGPIVMVQETKVAEAREVLQCVGFIAKEGDCC
ncbi:glycine/sarcosine/betaine reductase complex component C subunit alpha [Clostridium sediminicola]